MANATAQKSAQAAHSLPLSRPVGTCVGQVSDKNSVSPLLHPHVSPPGMGMPVDAELTVTVCDRAAVWTTTFT